MTLVADVRCEFGSNGSREPGSSYETNDKWRNVTWPGTRASDKRD
jgi:hypothetical protein